MVEHEITGLVLSGVGIAAILFSALFTAVFRQYALRANLLDEPNARSSHEIPTPRGGGIAVVVVFWGCLLFLWYSSCISLATYKIFMAGGGLVALVGLADDHYALPAKFRFAVHLTAALLVVILLPVFPDLPLFSLVIHPGYLSGALAAISLVWLLNLYNFMDGIDGIAGVETISIASGAAFIIWLHNGTTGYVLMLLFLGAATCGFLLWNWPPAKIFMGDACSGFLGFSFGVFALITSVNGVINLWSWLILLSVFIVDATITLVQRVLKGKKFYKAHRSHAYQILARRWRSHKKVTLTVFFVNIIWCLPLAVLAAHYPYWGAAVSAVALAVPAVIMIKLGAGVIND